MKFGDAVGQYLVVSKQVLGFLILMCCMIEISVEKISSPTNKLCGTRQRFPVLFGTAF